MTEHVTLNTVMHAAFRRTIVRFDEALRDFPDGSLQRAAQLRRAWDFFDHELHTHHGYEEDVFWPALQQTDADLSSVDELDHEHEQMRLALAEATEVMRSLPAEPTTARAAEARTAVAHLGEVLNDHLTHEERDLEPISGAYADSAPMKKATQTVIRRHLRFMGDLLAFVHDGADASDVAFVKKEIPPPVLLFFTHFGGKNYKRNIAPTWTT